MAAFPSRDSQPLKKRRLEESILGPPDVYPQDPKQKEDELSHSNVKHGFKLQLLTPDTEYGSARDNNVSQDKIGINFSSILSRKEEINTLADNKGRKPQINIRENFWHVATKSARNMENWFADLASNKSLSSLSKRVPIFNKKEEVFSNLFDNKVPRLLAAWYIKMASAFAVANSETRARGSRKTNVEPPVDWCNALTKYMNTNLLMKLSDYHQSNQSSTTTSFLTATQSSAVNKEEVQTQWTYHTHLARHMFEEGLLDRQEFLTWLVDVLEKTKMADETIIKMVLDQTVKYAGDIAMSELLSRRLCTFCCKKITQMCNEAGCTSPRTQSPLITVGNNGSVTTTSANQPTQHPVSSAFSEYCNCPQHRSILLQMSAIVQTICLKCPTALVWNSIGDNKTSSALSGSPLDHLVCAPASLPIPPGPHNQQIRIMIKSKENQIRQRSLAAETKWSSDKCQQSATGNTISRTLQVLDTLDRHKFSQTDPTSSTDSLYRKVFTSWHNKDSENQCGDEPIVNLLCEWAMSSDRVGVHKALVVAKLLAKRQSELNPEKYSDSEMSDDKEGIPVTSLNDNMFQNVLFNFLDTKGPVLDENPSQQNSVAFGNLVLLFCELIRHDVFSHDQYLCTLISRGDLSTPAACAWSGQESSDLMSVKSDVYSVKHDPSSVDPSIHEEDVDIFGGAFKDESRSSPAQPASVKSDREFRQQGTPVHAAHASPAQAPEPPRRQNRHLIYVTHFPIPQDDYYSHECSQRQITLFGVGKGQEEVKKAKRVTKEIMKLFSKKNCIDVTSGDMVNRTKRKKDGEGSVTTATTTSSLETIWARFSRLSYYDQHAVTTTCATQMVEQIGGFAKGSWNTLPVIENVAFLFELMESCLNICGLTEFVIQLLKELSELQSQLQSQLSEKSSGLAGTYPGILCLNIVAILRNYHSCLLLEQDQCGTAFEGLVSVVKHVSNPSACTSFERCILSYLYDLYTSCSYLRDKYAHFCSGAISKVQQSMYTKLTPSNTNLLCEPNFMASILANPKAKPDQSIIKQLHENPGSKYSFVCNAILAVVNCQNVETLNEIGLLCAELTASCISLSSEWLGALKALCCSSDHSSCGFMDVLTQVDVVDVSIHDNIAIFTSILIARYCFSLTDLVAHVFLPSLMAARPSGEEPEAEPGARLSCHLVVTLFKSRPQFGKSLRQEGKIKSSCDRHLLEASHNSVDIGAVLAVLKAILVLGDNDNGRSKRKDRDGDVFLQQLLSSVSDHDDMDLDQISAAENAGLSDFAKLALQKMCCQDWVREKFLKEPEKMFTSDLLLDSVLTHKQAQHLLYMICYPGDEVAQLYRREQDQRHVITNILQNLDKWFLRISWMELQLLFKQTPPNDDKTLLDNIAKATIEVFQQQTEQRMEAERDSVWLVGPLIAKLPTPIQGRVLKSAGQVLETGNNFWSKSKADRDRLLQKSSLLSHQPFLSLVLNCLRGQDQQREGLLESLSTQLEKFITNSKEHDKLPEDPKLKQLMYEALQLRLNLVGGMFDTIQRNNSVTQEWSVLLLQLVTHGVVDLQNNTDLFYTVVDMLATLIHGIFVGDGGSERSDENKKPYLNLMKKLKKEVADKIANESIIIVRHLLPIPKVCWEVITAEPHGNLVDTKGNKIADFSSIHKKKGLQVAGKEKVSPFHLLEGQKNPQPLSWAWFNAIRLEKRPLKYEEQHRLLLYHSHSLKKPLDYFLKPPPLPPLEPQIEKSATLESTKSVDQEDNAKAAPVDKKPAKKPARNKRINKMPSAPTYGHSPLSRGHFSYGQEPSMFQPGPHPSWAAGGFNQAQQGPYFGQQQLALGTPRFGSSPSKQAIRNMLTTRQPPNQAAYMAANQQPMDVMKQQRQLLRHKLQAQQQQRQLQSEYGRALPPGNTPLHHMSSQAPPQLFSNYGGPGQTGMQPQQSGMMEPGPDMMSQNFGQPYQPQQSQMPPPMRSQFSGGGGFPGMPQRSFSQPAQGYPPAAMNRGNMVSGGGGPPQAGMAMGNMGGGYNQMGPMPSQPPQQQGQGFLQNVSQQQQQLRQQQLLAMRNQRNSAQMQQPNPAYVAQLRQMSNQPPPGQPPPQYGGYQQPPPY